MLQKCSRVLLNSSTLLLRKFILKPIQHFLAMENERQGYSSAKNSLFSLLNSLVTLLLIVLRKWQSKANLRFGDRSALLEPERKFPLNQVVREIMKGENCGEGKERNGRPDPRHPRGCCEVWSWDAQPGTLAFGDVFRRDGINLN